MPTTAADLSLVEEIANGYCRGRNTVDRDDLVSDGSLGLMKAVEQWDSRRLTGDRKAFLARFVQRAMVDGLRSRNGRRDLGFAKQRFRSGMVRLDWGDDDGNSPLDSLAARHGGDMLLVTDMLAALPPRERLIVWRTVVEGYAYVDVAAELGVSEAWVSVLRDRALRKLRGGGGRPRVRRFPPRKSRGEPVHEMRVPSVREMEVLREIADGKTNDEAAVALFMAVETVKSHTRKILMKLNAKNRAHAVAIAFRHGLIE